MSSLEQLISESEELNTDTDIKLVNDFMEYEYERASWDASKMGDKEQLRNEMFHNISHKNRKKTMNKKMYRYGIAASIALALLIGFSAILGVSPPKQLLLSSTSVPDSIKLADGSIIYLATHSTIQYPESFKGKDRKVALLRGEAFFKVAKDPIHPFIIQSGDLQTRVLGTSFHISLAQETPSVTVVTGKVQVSLANQELNLIPGEQVIVGKQGLEMRKVAAMEKYSWYKKELNLKDVSLGRVLDLLKLRYGVNFETADEYLLETRITIYLKKETTLKNLLHQMNYITNLKFKAYGETVKVSQ